MSTSIVMPQLGESVAEGIIGKWLKGQGDPIEKDEPIVEVITDKVNAEIPSPVAGFLLRVSQPEGATVAVGDEIALIGDAEGDDAPPNGSHDERAGLSGAEQTVTPAPPAGAVQFESSPASDGSVSLVADLAENGHERVRSSPLVRRLAEQYGISLTEVTGTGIGGRVSKQDILSYVESRQSRIATSASRASTMVASPEAQPDEQFDSAASPLPTVAHPLPPAVSPPRTQFAPTSGQAATSREVGPNEELVPVSPLRKMIAQRMAQSMYTIPHATTMMEVDMSRVVRYRDTHKVSFQQREGVPLSYVAFVLKSTVEALKEFPIVNAEWAGDNIIMKRDINICVAVDAPDGLTTPVIHHADDRSLAGLSKAIYDLAMRARSKKLTVTDMQGGTFTVNNTGALGSVGSVSIINYPQAGILTANAIVKRPVVMDQDGEDLIAVRSMMNLSFSFDHRLLDGGTAAAFVNAVKAKLESFSTDYPIY